MFKIISFSLLTLISSVNFAADKPVYEGIWQDTDNLRSYYTIQKNNDQVVLISLAAVEATGNSVKSTYSGTTSELVLTQVSPNLAGVYKKLKLSFQSATDAQLNIVCDNCDARATVLKKVF